MVFTRSKPITSLWVRFENEKAARCYYAASIAVGFVSTLVLTNGNYDVFIRGRGESTVG